MHKADGRFFRRGRGFQKGCDVLEQGGNLPVVLRHLAGELLVGCQYLPETDNRPHDGHMDFNSTPESMATPSWVKARGRNLGSRCFWEPVTNCDRFMASASSRERRNIKSSGKRSAFRVTAWLNAFVGTPYSSAKSKSSITFWLRSR